MAPEYFAYLAGRILKGFSYGVISVIAPMFIYEISPLHYRGPLIAITQQSLTIGMLGTLLMGLTLPEFKRDDSLEVY